MKKIFMIYVLVVAFMGCGGSSTPNADNTPDISVSITGSEVTVPNANNMNSAKKAESFNASTYPQIIAVVTFHRGGISYSGTSVPLDPSTTSVKLNSIVDEQSFVMDTIQLISATLIGCDGVMMTIPDTWANDYDVTVKYFVSESEVYSDTKSYYISTDEYIQKFTEAGIGPSKKLTHDGEYLGTGQTWGDVGFWEYTLEQAHNVALSVSFDVTLPTN